ncbi:hypothetical protein ACFQ36_01160 [Arthrobacter sp. GCM10027362]|uniref:hypothetical protein n=1 Tax=Arthrobacter sp. GCM10027362 TaxID=3273379 RepID=UPI00362DEB9C
MRWSDPDGKLTLIYEDDSTSGEITASLDEWLEMVVGVLQMMPGKLNADRNGFALGPVGSDPDMIGALVAARLKESSAQ